jgi:hypothetical protein
LVFGAAGNDRQVNFPAWYGEVCAVGALKAGAPGGPPFALADYAIWDEKAGKPDLFAPKDAATARLDGIVEPGYEGSSFAALLATGAALLGWATDRSLTAAEVRGILVDTAVSLDPGKPKGPKCLDLHKALAEVRRRSVLRQLAAAGDDLRALTSRLGLTANVLKPVLAELEGDKRIRRRTSAGVERFELLPADDRPKAASSAQTRR